MSNPTDHNRISKERLDEAMQRAQIKSDRELARRVGVAPSQPGNWRRGDTTPTGENLAKLCRELSVTPAYLFGHDEKQARGEAARTLRQLIGDPEARIVESLGLLSEAERQRIADRIDGMVDALRDQRAPVETVALPGAQHGSTIRRDVAEKIGIIVSESAAKKKRRGS